MQKIAILSDIHINLTHNKSFELDRLEKLSAILSEGHYDMVVLNGDLFDKARPSLEEIKALRSMIEGLTPQVYIISGNHESVNITNKLSTYDFIGSFGCDLVKDTNIIIEGYKIRMTSWSHISALGLHDGSDILISHLRSDLPPFIKAERSMEFVHDYQVVILGDIHDKYSPYSNTHYTNSPYSTKFSSSEPTGSFIELTLDGSEVDWQYVDTNLPQKIKLVQTVEEYKAQNFNTDNIYKVVVEGTLQEVRNLNSPKNVQLTRVIAEVSVEVEEIPDNEDLFDLLTHRVASVSNTDVARVSEILNKFNK